MLKSSLQIHKDIYRAQCRKYNDLLSKAKVDFYRTKINTSNQQDLFKMVKSLSSPTGSSALPTTDSPVQLAQRFADFFSQKITKLRVKLELATCGDLSIDLVDQCQSQLDDFHDVCEEDVKSVIISSSSSTCGLDPLPTKLAKKCLNEFANSNNCLGQRKLIIRGYATSIQESYCNAYTKKRLDLLEKLSKTIVLLLT